MNGSAGKPPIFVLGVPRSGTTLLRTILDSHPAIACGPETPWLGGHQPRSVMELWRFLREDKHGVVASYGLSAGSVTAAAREFVDRLLGEYARSRGKSRWAEKTPDNALYVDFLLELFPGARFVHLVRDGLDVAVSTCIVEEHRRGISSFLERHLGFGPGVPAVENSPFNALLRWGHWNRLIERSLAGREHLRLSYERLVTEPEGTVRSLMEFVGEPFVPAMLEYQRFGHDYPEWEWGSADVRARGGITGGRVGRAKRELSEAQRLVLEPMARAAAGERAAAPAPWSDECERTLSGFIAGFARPMGLAHDSEALRAGAGEWRRLIAAGPRGAGLNGSDSGSPIAWIAALMGARVRIAAERAPDPRLIELRDRLRVDLEWVEPRRGTSSIGAAPAAVLSPRAVGPAA